MAQSRKMTRFLAMIGGAGLVFAGLVAASPPAVGAVTYPTSVRLTVSKTRVTPGAAVALAATFTSHGRARALTYVTLTTRDGNARVTKVRLRTSRAGRAATTVRPRSTSRYTWTIAAAGTARAASAATAVTVSSYASVTRLTAAPAAVTLGGKSTLTGTVTVNGRAWAGASVSLMVGTSRRATAKTGSTGRVAFSVAPTVATTYVLSTAQFLPNRASHSAALRVGVNYPSKVTLSASSPTIVQGDGTTMNGTVLANNKVWPGAPVELRGGPSPVSGVTGLDGKVAFTVHPSATTTYTLVALTKLPNLTSTSNQVTVTVTPPPPSQVSVTTLTASPSDVNNGAQTTLTGHVTVEGAPWVGASVTLVAVGMQPRTGVTDAFGDVSFVVTPNGTTVYTLTVTAGGQKLASSDDATVTVYYPAVVTLTPDRAKITTGGFTVLTATVTTNGAPLAGIGVSLLLVGEAEPVGFGTTDDTGMVVFAAQSPTGTADYQVVTVAALHYPSVNATTTVSVVDPVNVTNTSDDVVVQVVLEATLPDDASGVAHWQGRISGTDQPFDAALFDGTQVTINIPPGQHIRFQQQVAGFGTKLWSSASLDAVSLSWITFGDPAYVTGALVGLRGHLYGGVEGLTMDVAGGGAGTDVIFGLLPHLFDAPPEGDPCRVSLTAGPPCLPPVNTE